MYHLELITKRAPLAADILKRALHRRLDVLEAKARLQFRVAFQPRYVEHQLNLPLMNLTAFRFCARFVGDKVFECTTKAKQIRPDLCSKRMDTAMKNVEKSIQ